MNAEQYRALVAKLEAINPSEPVLEAPVAAFGQNADSTPDAAAPVGSVAADPAVAPTEAPATDPNQIPTIEAATFSQAYAQAKKQGLKKFKWCGVYAVKDKPQPVRPQPKADTLPTTRTVQPQYDVKNDPAGRLQAGLGNLI